MFPSARISAPALTAERTIRSPPWHVNLLSRSDRMMHNFSYCRFALLPLLSSGVFVLPISAFGGKRRDLFGLLLRGEVAVTSSCAETAGESAFLVDAGSTARPQCSSLLCRDVVATTDGNRNQPGLRLMVTMASRSGATSATFSSANTTGLPVKKAGICATFPG